VTVDPLVQRTLPPTWVSDAGLAGFVLAGAWITPGASGPVNPELETLLVNAVAAGFVPLRRRRFAVALVGVCVATLVSAGLGDFNPGVVLAVATLAYSGAARLERRRAGALTLTLAVAVTFVSVPAWGWSLQVPMLVAAAGALGDAARSRREYLQAMTERVLRAEATRDSEARRRVAEDRLSIARDLHDVVAHQIAVINLHASAASAALRDRPDDADRSLQTIRTASRTVLSEIGDLLATLRDPSSPHLPAVGFDDIGRVLDTFAEHGLDVTRRVVGVPRPLPSTVGVTALRVVQETLTNAHKHGRDQRAHLLVEYRPHDLHIAVTNPVAERGDDTAGGGHGLLGMRERVESARGTLSYGRVEPGSWQVDVVLPTRTPQSDGPGPEEHP